MVVVVDSVAVVAVESAIAGKRRPLTETPEGSPAQCFLICFSMALGDAGRNLP